MKASEEIDAIKTFSEDFFTNLKCKLNWQENSLLVEDVPKEFVDYFKKPSPYILVFDPMHVKNGDYELMTKGSLLLKAMSSFLNEKGKTTLLKIELNPNLEEELQKRLIIKGYDIDSIKFSYKNDYIFMFTFLSIIQYLNEKEQLTNTIYIHEKDIIDNFKIENYITSEGKKEDLIFSGIKEEYILAKEELKRLIQPKKEEIFIEINKSLNEAIERIKSHYLEKIYEIGDESGKNIEKIQELELKLIDIKAEEKQLIRDKIKKLNLSVSKIDKTFEKETLEKEKDYYINEEKQKHSINVTNSLINTTIIYYPVFNVRLYLKKPRNRYKGIEITYNPLTKQLSKLYCETCKTELKQLILCSKSHLSCEKCISKCPLCNNEICKSCDNINCNICGRKMCSKCLTQCSKCLKPACVSDTVKDSLTNKDLCSNCSNYCSICGKYKEKSYFKKCSSCNKDVCNNCSIKSTKSSRILCRHCSSGRINSSFL